MSCCLPDAPGRCPGIRNCPIMQSEWDCLCDGCGSPMDHHAGGIPCPDPDLVEDCEDEADDYADVK